MSGGKTRALFVNSGILGMRSFAGYLREAMADDAAIEARHIVLSEDLSAGERVLRRLMCARLWRDGWLGAKNVDLARLRHELHAGLQAARRIRRALRSTPADVVHFHRQATAYASLDLMARIPAVISIDCTQDAVIAGASSALERWTYRPNAVLDGRILCAAAAVVSTSEWAARAVRHRYPECRTPIHVMPTPVRLAHFPAALADERHARAVDGYTPRALFIGGDFVRKGGLDLIDAWRSARLDRCGTLDLVTDWPALPVDGVAGIRVHRRVEAYSPEWSALWRAADVFVMPSHSDAFPNVLQEAAAAGLPSVSTRADAIPEIVHDGATGMLIRPGDRVALADALRQLLGSAALRQRMGRAARARAAVSADPDAYRDRLRAILQDAAGQVH
jgi:glycosyltransferase involved in cell wall biosynthesis